MANWLEQFWKYLMHGISGGTWNMVESVKSDVQQSQIDSILKHAEEDPTGAQGKLSELGLELNPDQEKWLDNLIANQRTGEARLWEEDMASNDLLRAASQLQQLGLSSSGVLQTGGSGVNPVGAADTVKTNIGMQRYAQRMSMAKQLLSMTSSMASAGIYGKALGAAKQASSVITSAASHSALRALNKPSTPVMSRDKILASLGGNQESAYEDMSDFY